MVFAKKEEKKCTYGELEKYPANEIWELLEGMPILQARPTLDHQYILGRLNALIVMFLDGKPCQVFTELAVWLDTPPEEKKNSTHYVVPDLVVVCEQDKIHKEGIFGVPDLVVEIISPATASVDKVKKFNQYQAVGVMEYWIIEPEYQTVSVFNLIEGRYMATHFDRESKVNVGIFQGQLEVDLAWVFPE